MVYLLIGVTGVDQGTPDFQDSSFKQNAFNSERPLDVQPTDQGGVAIDGRGDLPEGHANMADKIVGKMQKVRFLIKLVLPVVYLGSDLLGWLVPGHRKVYEQTGTA